MATVCVRRLLTELRGMLREPLPNVSVVVDETDLHVWHAVIHGLEDERFKGGEYVLRVLVPQNYPFSPPDFVMLTPSGRFATDKKLCMSNSGFHPDEWSPLWNMKTIILGFLSLFLEPTSVGIGHLSCTLPACRDFAAGSRAYNDAHLGHLVKHRRNN